MSQLLDDVRTTLRLKHYSIRTEAGLRRLSSAASSSTTTNAIRATWASMRFVSTCRTWLTDRQVAASTQNVALAALLFLYKEVLHIELPLIDGVERAKRPQRVPVVLTPDEVKRVLAPSTGTHHLMASLLYGAGLRLMECVRLRIKDLDFDYQQITRARRQRRDVIAV
ncbi:MAG: hypothetical protein WKG07_39940 [Hymenobacter sp.]